MANVVVVVIVVVVAVVVVVVVLALVSTRSSARFSCRAFSLTLSLHSTFPPFFCLSSSRGDSATSEMTGS